MKPSYCWIDGAFLRMAQPGNRVSPDLYTHQILKIANSGRIGITGWIAASRLTKAFAIIKIGKGFCKAAYRLGAYGRTIPEGDPRKQAVLRPGCVGKHKPGLGDEFHYRSGRKETSR
jgi:hypothetical protein